MILQLNELQFESVAVLFGPNEKRDLMNAPHNAYVFLIEFIAHCHYKFIFAIDCIKSNHLAIVRKINFLTQIHNLAGTLISSRKVSFH